MKLKVQTVVDAPLEKVWESFWNPKHITWWCFADKETWHCPWAKWDAPHVWAVFTNRMEARDGSFGFNLTAQYTKVIPMSEITYTLWEMKEDFQDAERAVEVFFEEILSGVKVTQKFDAEETHSADKQIEGWQMILNNFKSYCELNK